MNTEEKTNFVFGRVKKDDKGKSYLTLEDLYDIYDKCKLRALIKIIKDESEITFYDEEGTTDNKEGDIKVSM